MPCNRSQPRRSDEPGYPELTPTAEQSLQLALDKEPKNFPQDETRRKT